MDISIVAKEFESCESTDELNKYITNNIRQIRVYFYGLAPTTLQDQIIEIEKLYSTFKSSRGYASIEMEGLAIPKPIQDMLLFFASIFDRVSSNSNYNIVSILPESSIKSRLKARLLAEEINNVQSHYTSTFHQILELLNNARYDGEEDYTQFIITFLIKHYHTALQQLSAKRYYNEISRLQNLYKDPHLHANYDFLTHPLLSEVIDGNIEAENDLEVVRSKSALYHPSDKMLAIFNSEISSPIFDHPKTKGYTTILGYDSGEIRRAVLEYGKADFRNGYKTLTEDDKVLLYCYFNMRKHYYTTFFVYERIFASLNKYFIGSKTIPVFMDLGCGPLTSGLALTDLHHQQTGSPIKLNYIGIDIAPAMLRKAESFWNTGVFDKESKCNFETSWNKIDVVLKGFFDLHNPLIINASYLFASSLLDESDLAKFISNLQLKYGTSKIYFIFQNPDNPDRNEKFVTFKSLLKSYTTYDKNVERVLYKNNPLSHFEPTGEDVYFEILELN